MSAFAGAFFGSIVGMLLIFVIAAIAIGGDK
jgi:hypothetical protein